MLYAKRPIPQLQRKTLRLWKKPWWPPRNRHTITYTTYIHILTYACLYACMYVCMYVCCVGEAGVHASDEDHARAVRAVSAPTISRKEDTRGHSNLQDIQRSRLMVFAPSHYIHTYIHTFISFYKHNYIPSYVLLDIQRCITNMWIYLPTYIHIFMHTYIHTYKHTYIHTATHFAMWWWSWRPLWTSCPLPTISTRTTSASPGARPSLVRYAALRILTNSIIHTYIHTYIHTFTSMHACSHTYILFTWIHIQRYRN
jgi:hypothetical protein